MSEKPVVGILAATELDAEPHAEAVRRSGGTPLLLTDRWSSVEDALRLIGGLLVSDSPIEVPDSTANEGSSGSEEVVLVRAALDRDMPVLGICSGMHTLNVTLGGTLTSDLPGHGVSDQNGEQVSSYHRIYISPGSKLAAIVGSGGFVRVNSRHDQGLREAQKSRYLMASAYSLEDGVIEAVESPEHDWVIGVQFQPERRMEIPPHFDRLFQGLVERAARVRG